MLDNDQSNRLLLEILDLNLIDLVGVVQDDGVGRVAADIGAVVLRFSLRHLHISALANVKLHFPINRCQLRPIFTGESHPFAWRSARVFRLFFGLDENADLSGQERVRSQL